MISVSYGSTYEYTNVLFLEGRVRVSFLRKKPHVADATKVWSNKQGQASVSKLTISGSGSDHELDS